MIDAAIRAVPRRPDMWPVFRADPRTGRLSLSGYFVSSPWFAREPIARVTWRDRERVQVGGYYDHAHGEIVCGDACTFALRLHDAPEWCGIRGYYGNPEDACDVYRPIIARLPRGRGFLAGWRMDDMGECFALDYSTAHETEGDATYAAHRLAESVADREAERHERVSCPTCEDGAAAGRRDCATCDGAGTLARWEIEDMAA